MKADEVAAEATGKALDYDVVVEVPRIGPGRPFDLWKTRRVRKDTRNGRLVVELDEPIEDTGA